MSDFHKNWWRPLWSGLVMDSNGKHSKKMRNSVWLFLYLLLWANPNTGTCFKNYAQISKEMGRKKETTRKWMSILKKEGYIWTKRKNKGLVIGIKKWKNFDKCSSQNVFLKESAQDRPDRVFKSDQSKQAENPEKPFYLSQKIKKEGFANIYNVINKDNNVVNKFISFKNFTPKTKEDLLALDLAKGLNDLKNLNFYLSIAKKYSEEILRRIYGQVKEIPMSKIKKSRGALFTYLLKNHGQNLP